ncbi:PREDICTED: odorant receptor 4-like [Trachymyrmex septentrionalis]|uniref:odorant receptor 4-like n=1 Tax=Trachymyrmex septentrionalis TaxID=34720 RepID=UPI00084F29FD|nr:PREDICTED: odorant receptor 4-like [Trachymyrmex septentrionalis]
MSYSFRVSSTRNVAYQQDNEYSIQLNRWFLKPIGAWPRTNAGIADKVLSRGIQFVCHSLIAFTVVPCALYIIFEPDVHLKLKAFGPMIHWLMGGANYCSLLMRSCKIRKCVDHMRADWQYVGTTRNREVMLQNAKFGRFVSAFCAVFMQGGVCSYSIITTLTPANIRIENVTITTHQLPCPFYTELVDTRYSPANEIVIVLQLLSTVIVNSVTVGACSLAAVFAMHACGQLSILMIRLDELVDETESEYKVTRRKLAIIVEQHLRVLSFVSQIETIMHQICLVELLGCTTDICMLGYYTITEWKLHDTKNLLTYFTIFIAMSCNIFIFCYIAEILTDQCQKIGEMAYMTEWYRLHHKIAIDLILIISRSNAVIKITAGKMIQLSIATFGDVMKTSFAYLNILRTVAT